MSDATTFEASEGFSARDAQLGKLADENVSALLAAAADVTLVLDAKGLIIDAAGASGLELAKGWIGKRWVETVTVESRPKVDALLRDALKGAPSRWRQINHPMKDGADLPMNWSARRSRPGGPVVAFARDLRSLASLQQRVAEAQQEMEREYARIRSAEKRYRLLFQLASEAIVIIDSDSYRIQEANPAAQALLGKPLKKIIGAVFTELFDDASRRAAQSFVSALLVAPRLDNVHGALAESGEPVLLSGAMFRQDGAGAILVTLTRVNGGAAVPAEAVGALRALERMPDAFALIDKDRRILKANAAFVDLAQAASEDRLRGEPIEKWLGQPGLDVDVLFANLAKHGALRNFSTILRGEHGTVEDVEVSAVDVSDGARQCMGFCIRSATPRSGRARLGGRELPRTAEQFTELVGRVPLKNLVRETTDLIERLCIEAALEMTRDNRASAAEILGLSRQALYTKLRRYGLGDLGDEEAGEE